VRDGRWAWDGQTLQLSLSEAGRGNAIHGLVRWVGWSAAEHPTDAVTLTTTVWPSPGYPFRVHLTATYRLDDDGLSVRLVARNDGGRPAPYGVGQHPYLTAGTGLADETVLTVPGNVRLLTDDRGAPVGREDVTGSAYDFREPRRVGDLVLDTAYTDLVRDDDGRVRVRLERPGGGGVGLWAGPTTRWLQVFTGETLAPERRRRSLAVEPMSCPPGALASGEDVVVLGAGDEHVLEWGIHSW
jgi:aldose 1-epimerase